MSRIQKYLAELIGTFMLVFIGTGAVIVDGLSGGTLGHLGIAIAFGSIIVIMIYACGHISGAHFNPAVTIAFAIFGKTDKADVVPYILSQLFGAIAGSAVLRIFFGKVCDLGATFPNLELLKDAAILPLTVEYMFTALLMFVIMSVATDIKAERSFAGIVIGLTILIGAAVAGPLTGGSFNPARTIGPAVMIDNYSYLWIYILGPITGAITGAAAYQLISTSCCKLIKVEK